MKAIWKYDLGPGRNEVVAPRGARFLSAGLQRGRICAWALVDVEATPAIPEVEMETRELTVFGTGHVRPAAEFEGRFLSTLLLHGDSLVMHVFADR